MRAYERGVVVDSLLKLVESQGADALVLPSDAPPSLEKGGEPKPLSMPPLGEDVLRMALEELTTADERATLSSMGTLAVRHTYAEGRVFDVTIELRSGRPRLTFRAEGSSESGSVSTPATRAAAAPSVASARAPVEPAPRSAPVEASEGAHATLTGTRGAGGLEPIIATGMLGDVLRRAEVDDASDVFLSVGNVPRLRVGTHLLEVGDGPLSSAELWSFVEPLLDPRARRDLERSGSVDLALEVAGPPPRRYRLNLFHQQSGLAAALRPIRSGAPTLRALDLPEDLYRLTEYRSGLVLMTGTTGSGKSTTLVALVEHINRTASKHIITIEDPIEYTYAPGQALVHQREVGRHVDRFDTGLRAALRESPDVILLGEMRDRETIAAALTAAETGHLVLSTLHCASAAMAIDRIVDVFPEHQQTQVRLQLAGALRAVVTQLLLPSTRPPARVPVFEKLLVNTAVATKIREGRVHQLQSEIQKGRSEGMVPLELTLAHMVRGGRLSMETALSVANDAQVLGELVRRGQ
jgi:twitching motility protein PilT